MEISRLTRDGTAEPISRDQILRHARGQGNIHFPIQLTTSRIGNLTRLIHTLLYVMTIHLYSQDSSRFPRRRPFTYLDRHTPSGQSRVYRVMHLHIDDVHCRESTDTGPVNLKVVPSGCCLGRSPWTSYKSYRTAIMTYYTKYV